VKLFAGLSKSLWENQTTENNYNAHRLSELDRAAWPSAKFKDRAEGVS
jgi:hypothetical protein